MPEDYGVESVKYLRKMEVFGKIQNDIIVRIVPHHRMAVKMYHNQ